MSKKSRRQRTLNLPPEAYGAPQVAPAASAPGAASPAAARPAAKPAAAAVNWQAEYGDVLGDLKRTGILAVALIAAMVVLSFIVR